MRDTFLTEPRCTKNKTIVAAKYAVARPTRLSVYTSLNDRRDTFGGMQVFRNAFNKICFSCHRGTYG